MVGRRPLKSLMMVQAHLSLPTNLKTRKSGRVWLMALVLKTRVDESPPEVQILSLPPLSLFMKGVMMKYGIAIFLTLIATISQAQILQTSPAITLTCSGGTMVTETSLVSSGGTAVFNLVPDPGFEVDSVKVDGVEQGKITRIVLTNVVKDTEIAITFTKYIPPPPPPPPVTVWIVGANSTSLTRPVYDPLLYPTTKKEIGRATVGTVCSDPYVPTATNYRFITATNGLKGIVFCVIK